MNTTVPFSKMNGIGNKIIVADMRGRADVVTSQAAVALASDLNTHFDQLMAIHAPGPLRSDARIEIYNSDGSKSGACGNGTRCIVDWLSKKIEQTQFTFEIQGNLLSAILLDDGRVSVNMGVPRLEWDQIPLSEEFADTRRIELQVGPIDEPILHTPSVVNMGNPHVIFFTANDVNTYALDKFGPMLEYHMLFPERANISVAQVNSPSELTMRTWERGAGLTLACGSAACAAAVAAARLEKTNRHIKVNQPGGSLELEWRDDNFVIMTGETEHEFDGLFNPVTGQWVRA